MFVCMCCVVCDKVLSVHDTRHMCVLNFIYCPSFLTFGAFVCARVCVCVCALVCIRGRCVLAVGSSSVPAAGNVSPPARLL